MSLEQKERLLELLSDRAVFGLTDAEIAELTALESEFPAFEDESFELTAAAIGMMDLDTSEAMPAHLRSKIIANAEQLLGTTARFAAEKEVDSADESDFQPTFEFEPKKSFWNWLGWAVAAAACVALALNLYVTRVGQIDTAGVTPTPAASPKMDPTAGELREQLLASAGDVVRSNWGDIDPKKPRNIEGDVVWSNSLQKGYLRFRNIPVNDKNKESYQLWIFDEKQKNPVDGGVFDANESGEIIVPIDAKIKVQKPTMFAVTAEKPGGVVVSDREVVMAIAKVTA